MDIKTGVSTLTGKDTDLCEEVQCDFLNQTQNVKDVTPYGFAHKCPTGSYYLIFQARKNADDNFGIGNEYETMPKGLKEGETAVYNGFTGAQIYLKEDGSIQILKSSGTSIKLNADDSIDLSGAKINLGIGGKKIARIGDEVTVAVPSHGNCTGTITACSSVNTSI